MRPVQQSLVDPSLERPVGPIPLSVVTGNNAQLIASVAELYLTGSVLDTTYGGGKWWDRYRPADFTFHDIAICKNCGTHIDLQVDHIHPVSKGGGNEFENLQTLCKPCNREKWNKVPD